jgi:hypothetical protein
MTPSYLDVRDWRRLRTGEPFTDQDVRAGKQVCLVGQRIVHELFEDASPLAGMLSLHGAAFRVIGVLGAKGVSGQGIDQGDIVLTPWTALASAAEPALADPTEKASAALDQLYPASVDRIRDRRPQKKSRSIDEIVVRARSVDDVSAAGRQITDLLRKRHRIAAGKADDFHVRDRLDLFERLKSAAGD